jgi:hypothetical protein
MKKWMKVAIPFAAVALVLAWYAFRPERLVVNRTVNEAMPTMRPASSHESFQKRFARASDRCGRFFHKRREEKMCHA